MFGRVVGISTEGQPAPVELCDLPALQAVGRGLAPNRILQAAQDLVPQAGPLPVLLLGQAAHGILGRIHLPVSIFFPGLPAVGLLVPGHARCFRASNFS